MVNPSLKTLFFSAHGLYLNILPMKMATDLSKVLTNIQYTWLSHKLKVSDIHVQSKVIRKVMDSIFVFQEQYLTGNFSLRLNWYLHDSEISLGQTCCSYNLKIKQFLLV